EGALRDLAGVEGFFDDRERLGADRDRRMAGRRVDARELGVRLPRRHEPFDPLDLGDRLVERGPHLRAVRLGGRVRGEGQVGPHRRGLAADALGGEIGGGEGFGEGGRDAGRAGRRRGRGGDRGQRGGWRGRGGRRGRGLRVLAREREAGEGGEGEDEDG